MIGTDDLLGLFVVGQLLFSTFQGGQRFLQTRTTPALEGPPILPETSPYLWEVTRAFQEAVTLDLLRDNYTNHPIRVSEHGMYSQRVCETEGYSLALKPDPSVLSDTSTDLESPLIQQHNESTIATISDETETPYPSNHYDDLLLEEVESEARGVTLHIDYSRPMPDSSTERTHHTSDTMIRKDYWTQLPAHNTTFLPSPIQIRAYAPTEFAQLRKLFGISEHAFRKSLVEESSSFVSFQSNSKGAARVGGIFFYSSDGGYLIKSIKQDEVPTFLRMLPQYSQFMKSNGRTTLLTRFCGMYDIGWEGTHHTLVIMNAVFPSTGVTERFDLKGSSVGRKVSEEERRLVKNAVLKDMDFIAESAISLLPGTKEAFLGQLRRDIGLLQNCSVIDYSLLIGVEPLVTAQGKRQSVFGKKLTNAFLSAVHGPIGVHGGKYATIPGTRNGQPALFHFGLIDFLQPFNHKKYLEWKVKSLLHENEEFSCIPPENYARRLLAFLDDNIC